MRQPVLWDINTNTCVNNNFVDPCNVPYESFHLINYLTVPYYFDGILAYFVENLFLSKISPNCCTTLTNTIPVAH